MSVSATMAWSVHLPTVDVTRCTLLLEPPAPGDPWPLSLALSVVDRAGAQRRGRPDAVGAGRGRPLITRAELDWDGAPLHLAATHASGSGLDELVLEAPAWDQLVGLGGWSEDRWWELVDALADATGAVSGAVGDGEAVGCDPRAGEEWIAALRRQIGLLLPAAPDRLAGRAALYRELPLSGLVVVLR
ncbi:MAG: hypothetical protein ABR541_08435 [Candidatus Dormibacteria bacterium]